MKWGAIAGLLALFVGDACSTDGLVDLRPLDYITVARLAVLCAALMACAAWVTYVPSGRYSLPASACIIFVIAFLPGMLFHLFTHTPTQKGQDFVFEWTGIAMFVDWFVLAAFLMTRERLRAGESMTGEPPDPMDSRERPAE